MIKIFNGQVRGIGVTNKREVFLQLQVRFKRYLKYFSPSQWMIFTVLALHMDEDGWAWPDIETICDLANLERKTVHRAIAALDVLQIKGDRVLLHFQTRKKHKGHFDRSKYLLFPKKEEVELFEQGLLTPPPKSQNGNTVKRTAARRTAELRTAARRNSEDGQSHHVHEPEPLFSRTTDSQDREQASDEGFDHQYSLSSSPEGSEDDDKKFVLEFYAALTGNSPTEYDSRTFASSDKLPRVTWLTALATGAIKCEDKVHHLAYFVPITKQVEESWHKSGERNLGQNRDGYFHYLLTKLVKMDRIDGPTALRFQITDGGSIDDENHSNEEVTPPPDSVAGGGNDSLQH